MSAVINKPIDIKKSVIDSILAGLISFIVFGPTAEVYAAAYKALGVPVYSSAVFNFIPKTAMDFYHAIAREDHATVGKIIDDFFLPYLDIRNRKAGYAVSIVKAGAKIVGYDAGPVRTPLTDLLPEEYEALAALIDKQGAQ